MKRKWFNRNANSEGGIWTENAPHFNDLSFKTFFFIHAGNDGNLFFTIFSL